MSFAGSAMTAFDEMAGQAPQMFAIALPGFVLVGTGPCVLRASGYQNALSFRSSRSGGEFDWEPRNISVAGAYRIGARYRNVGMDSRRITVRRAAASWLDSLRRHGSFCPVKNGIGLRWPSGGSSSRHGLAQWLRVNLAAVAGFAGLRP